MESLAPNRQAGLSRSAEFAGRSGPQYARSRNFDFGPDNRGNVSLLSPYLRHRLILEQEVLGDVFERHSPASAQKFVDEIFWRAYFKGWLEQHPRVWTDYSETLLKLLRELEADTALLERYNSATGGNTGIDCFDAWVAELQTTGYLHNHARMWFASIWVFTLRLPWQLGADFLIRHLLDGDPASNTLSWRWVSGLHTPGKTYLARVSNIANYTDNRFNPQGQLATSASPIEKFPTHTMEPLPAADSLPPNGSFGLLVTEEDCAPEIGLLQRPPAAILGIVATRRRSPLPVGLPAYDFASGAVSDSVARAARAYDAGGEIVELDQWEDRLLDWASSKGCSLIVTPYTPIGPTRELLVAVRERLEHFGISLLQLRRSYDDISWPHASRGYFKLKKKIPLILDRLGLTENEDSLQDKAS